MWRRPRATMQFLDRHPSRNGFWIMAWFAGSYTVFNRAISKSLGDQYDLWSIIGAALVFGGLGGALTFQLGSYALKWTGRLLGGRGSVSSLRAAVTWAHVPIVAAWVLNLFQIVLFGEALFQSSFMESGDEEHGARVWLLLGLLAVEFTLWIWYSVVLFHSVAEVQGFPVWKAVVNCGLALLVLALIALALAALWVSFL